MLRKLFGCIAAFGMSLTIATFPSASIATAQDAASDRFAELLEEGKQLERDHRWQEAIQRYEKLHRKYPQQNEVERRLQIVRIHFDVTRRYADPSYLETLDKTSPAAALELLDEVLLRLEGNYVEPIDFSRLLRKPTAFLEVALQEKDFLQENVSPSVRAEQVEQFRANVHRNVVGKNVTNINDVRTIVIQVTTQARDQIGLPPTAVIHEYIAGFVGLLDPYSAYLTAGEYVEIMSQIEGNLIGLGVELSVVGNELRIVDVFKGGPAFEVGLRKGDRLTEVGGVRVEQVGAKSAADLLRGPANSTVRIEYRRGEGAPLQTVVRRRRVEVPSVNAASMVDERNGIGYIRISNFQQTTPREVEDTLRSLYQQGLKSLIIDIRRNPGGLLNAAVDIADKFITTGPIVKTRGKNELENQDYSAQMPGTWEIPLVVMIDADSASASEIFAGAIRDHNRGLVVGRTSFGKGSVQGIYRNYKGDGGIRLTTSKFFSPNGYAISSRGVQPHLHFEEPIVSVPRERTAAKIPVSAPLNGSKTIEPTVTIAESPDNQMDAQSDMMQPNEDSDLLQAIEAVKLEVPKLIKRK